MDWERLVRLALMGGKQQRPQPEMERLSVLVPTLLHGFKALIGSTQAEMWQAAEGYGSEWRVVCTCEQSRSSPGKIVLNHRHRFVHRLLT